MGIGKLVFTSIRILLIYSSDLYLWSFIYCPEISVIDSSAKMPSGILKGNLNQYGDFDECINVIVNNGMSGQYCLVAIQLKNPIFSNYISAHHQVKNNLTDVTFQWFSNPP